MLVYKYRGGDEKTLNRDISSVGDNYFWSPGIEELNDPFEALVFSDKFEFEISILQRIFKIESKATFSTDLKELMQKIRSVGIYSLSATWNNELMWAHYGSSHKGFCIEYDLDTLLDADPSLELFYPFGVNYSNIPPDIAFSDIISKEKYSLLRKLVGTKSEPWTYENEFRIATEKKGEQYYFFQALKSIYFGHRMDETDKNKIMEKLKGRGIKYYQIVLKDKSYELDRREVKDKFKNSKPYLFEIWRPTDKDGEIFEKIAYRIIEKSKFPTKQKAILKIELDQKITQQELEELAHNLREKLFSSLERVFIFYYIRGDDNGTSWANSHFHPDRNPEIKIYDT